MRIKTDRQSGLPRFVLGALATAGASVANAATVQITFANNYVADAANGGLTNFNADLPGGGWADALSGLFTGDFAGIFTGGGADRLGIASAVIRTSTSGDTYQTFAVSVRGVGSEAGLIGRQLRGVVAHSFTDGRINGGVETNGWFDLTASAGPNGSFVRINRLIFDDAAANAPTSVSSEVAAYTEWSPVSAVPEASSSLALLALGAGGLLTRRRQKRAA